MLPVTVITWTMVGLGFVASAGIGWALRKVRGCMVIFALAFFAVGLGLALFFVGGFFHSFCERTLKMCYPTSAENVWGFIFPLILSPAYWLVAVIIRWLGRNGSGYAQN
jgi:hypothetical protein